jgi:CHAD domain-containing protein
MPKKRSRQNPTPSKRRLPDIAALVIASLAQRWRKYLKELRRCRKQCSEESVHDLRVATRRLISTLMIVEILLPASRVQKLQRRLKRLFDTMSPLRDTQVQLLALEKKVVQIQELETLITILKLRERAQMRRIGKRVAKIDAASLGAMLRRIKKKLQTISASRLKKNVSLTAALGEAAEGFIAIAALRERLRISQPRTVHRMRIAFKKFRYKVEALQPFLRKVTARQLKAMDKFQTRMGEIQDIEVLSATVQRFMTQRGASARSPLARYSRELRAQKQDLIRAFIQSSREINSYWR